MDLLKGIFGNKETLEQVDQQKQNDELCAWVKSKVEEIRRSSNRVAHEGIWMQNIAYVLGFDGVYYDNASRSFKPINNATGAIKRNRMHVNKILPTLQNRLAKLCKNPPKYDVRPDSNEQEDRDNAEFKLNILNAKWDEYNLNEKRIPLYMWVQECGHAYVGCAWDSTLGQIMTDPETGESDFMGDVRVDVVSPFEIFPDPLAKTVEECRYLIRAKVRPLTYFCDQFGEEGSKVKAEPTWLLSAQYDQRIQSINTKGASNSDSATQLENTAIELSYYEKPTKKHPKGRLAIIASGTLLKDAELPIGKIPFAKFDDILIGGKFYSESVTTHLRPLQDQFNELVRRRSDWVKKLLAGKYTSPRGNNLAQEALSDSSGEILEYDPVPNAPNGGKPEPMDIPMIPSYAYTEEDKIDQQFNEVSGISEVSKGNLPSAGIPAIGMQLLVEMDDTRIGVMTEQHEISWAKVGQFILDYIQKYYVFERKIKFAQKSGYNVKTITGDDLKGTNDVIVIRGSTLPGSKTLKRQEILNYYDRGLLGSPQDPKVQENLLGMLQFGDVSDVYTDYSLDMAMAKNHIDTIERGDIPHVDEKDNHIFIIQELNRYRKSDKFKQLPQDNQEILNAVIEESIRKMGQQSGAIPPDPPGPEEQAMIDTKSAATGELMNEQDELQTALINSEMAAQGAAGGIPSA